MELKLLNDCLDLIFRDHVHPRYYHVEFVDFHYRKQLFERQWAGKKQLQLRESLFIERYRIDHVAIRQRLADSEIHIL